MSNEKISIVLPIYNEEKVIKQTIEEIKSACLNANLNFEIIAVDDCSKDNSAEILKGLGGITVVSHQLNRGYGASLKTGIKNSQGDWIIITDVDGTYPNKDIPKLAEFIPDYDMVVGARHGQVAKDPLIRRSAKNFLNKFASFLTGQKIQDINSGLRLFKKSIALEYWHLFPERFSFTSILTMVCFTNNFPVKYIPIDYYKRVGKSSIKPKNFIDFIKLVTKMSLYFKPFKVFSIISLTIFLLALAMGFYSAFIIGKLADVTTMLLVVTALQTFFFGVLAEIVIKTHK